MHFSTLLNAAVVVLSFTDVTSAHVVFVDAYGNAAPAIRGFGLGHHAGTQRKGFAQYPQQRDIAVFNQRAVHTGWWKGYLPNGCGTSILSVTQWYQKHQPAKWNGKGVTDAKRKWLWTQTTPAGGYIDTKLYVNWLVNQEAKKGTRKDIATNRPNLKNGVPKVTAGGTLNVLAWQVNLDGGGHFKCKIDYLGTGGTFTQNLQVKKNCGGNAKSLHVPGIQKTCWFTVVIPPGLNCKGAYGSAKDICMVRCENSAKNGPFGGCIPIQQIRPKPKPAPKPIVVTVRPPPQIITVTKGNVITVTKGDIVTVPKGDVVTVTKAQTLTVTQGQKITIIFNGVTRVSTCTKKGVVTVTNATPVTVTQKSTITVTDKAFVTVTEDSVVTITKAPEVATTTTVVATATEIPVAEDDPENDDANKPTTTATGTRTPTAEELEAAKGGEDIDPADLEEVKNEKIDEETKEELKEEVDAGGKSGEPLPDEEITDIGYF
ncbi:hypothetical protein TWF281_000004 [Arthrobotrys megalospora]